MVIIHCKRSRDSDDIFRPSTLQITPNSIFVIQSHVLILLYDDYGNRGLMDPGKKLCAVSVCSLVIDNLVV